MWVAFTEATCQAVCRFGVRFQAACLLGSLGFQSPINRGLQTFWVTFFNIFISGPLLLLPIFYIFADATPVAILPPSHRYYSQAFFGRTLNFLGIILAGFGEFAYTRIPFCLFACCWGRFFGICDFLDAKWMLRSPKCKALVLSWRKQLRWEERLIVFARVKVFYIFLSLLLFCWSIKGYTHAFWLIVVVVV